METILVETKNGEKKEIVYNVKDFPYNSFLESKTARKRKVEYLNIVATFDIETTTIRKRKTDKIKRVTRQWGLLRRGFYVSLAILHRR